MCTAWRVPFDLVTTVKGVRFHLQIYARVIFNGKLAKSLAHRPGPGIIEGSSFARFDHFFLHFVDTKT